MCEGQDHADALLAGYRRFRAETWPAERQRYEALAEGQQPATLVISCADSRVDPQTVFGARPGELFVVRNVAALVPRYEPDAHYHGTSAAVEYAVRVLKVSRVAVLGHARCGGVQAMIDGAPDEAGDFVRHWITIARDALVEIPRDLPRQELLLQAECAAVRQSLTNLLTFPWVRSAVEYGRLALQGFRFDILTGVLQHVQQNGVVPVV